MSSCEHIATALARDLGEGQASNGSYRLSFIWFLGHLRLTMSNSEGDTFIRRLKKKSSMKLQMEDIFQSNPKQPNYLIKETLQLLDLRNWDKSYNCSSTWDWGI